MQISGLHVSGESPLLVCVAEHDIQRMQQLSGLIFEQCTCCTHVYSASCILDATMPPPTTPFAQRDCHKIIMQGPRLSKRTRTLITSV